MSTSSSVSDAAVPPALSLAEVLASVETAVGYLRVATTVSGEDADDWLSCSGLIADARRLADVIRSTMAGRGTQQESVAASLFVQSYAFRVGALVLAPYALGLAVPSCSPADTFIRLTRHRPGAVAVTDPDVSEQSVEHVVGALLGQHLAPLIGTTTSIITIGRRLLWGNVAASCATVFRAIDGSAGADRAEIQRRSDLFFAAADSWLKGLGGFETVRAEPVDHWRWQRTNCCLYYQCAGASKCDDCSLDRVPDGTAVGEPEPSA